LLFTSVGRLVGLPYNSNIFLMGRETSIQINGFVE
jgi:hypothetical protein